MRASVEMGTVSIGASGLRARAAYSMAARGALEMKKRHQMLLKALDTDHLPTATAASGRPRTLGQGAAVRTEATGFRGVPRGRRMA